MGTRALGFGHIVVSGIELPNLLVILVKKKVDERSCKATVRPNPKGRRASVLAALTRYRAAPQNSAGHLDGAAAAAGHILGDDGRGEVRV